MISQQILSFAYIFCTRKPIMCIFYILFLRQQCPQLDRSVILKGLNYKHCYLFIFYLFFVGGANILIFNKGKK